MSSSTRGKYLWALGQLDSELGTVRLRRLDVDTIERALDSVATGTVGTSRGKPLARASVARVRDTLALALDFGVRRKMLATNPARLAVVTPTAKRHRSDVPSTPRKQTNCGTPSRVNGSAHCSEPCSSPGFGQARRSACVGMPSTSIEANDRCGARFASNAAPHASSTSSRRTRRTGRSPSPHPPSRSCALSGAPSPR